MKRLLAALQICVWTSALIAACNGATCKTYSGLGGLCIGRTESACRQKTVECKVNGCYTLVHRANMHKNWLPKGAASLSHWEKGCYDDASVFERKGMALGQCLMDRTKKTSCRTTPAPKDLISKFRVTTCFSCCSGNNCN